MAGLRVGVLGRGSIAGPVIHALQAGEIPGAELAGVVVAQRDRRVDRSDPLCDLPDLVTKSDVVVEAAGQKALAEHGPYVVGAGVDLLVLSVGALVDRDLQVAMAAGPGRMFVCSGAVGGLDLIRAAAVGGGLRRVRMTSRKLPATLIQSWMDSSVVDRLHVTTEPVEVGSGSPLEIARLFPKSANIAAAVGVAAGSWDIVEVVMTADPSAVRTRHVVEIDSQYGSYRFDITHATSPDNPGTAAIVPLAVIRSLRDLSGCSDGII